VIDLHRDALAAAAIDFGGAVSPTVPGREYEPGVTVRPVT
jgi:hypothetical protein